MNIRFVPQEEIDRQLWNSCVHYATNGNVFGYDWYLNNTARDWDALVEDDNYTAVLPLPYVKNWLGRPRLQQPRLLPELALYSCNALSPKRVQAFWDAVSDRYRSGKLTLEPASLPGKHGPFDLAPATGSALLLQDNYETIIDDFPPSYFQALARAEEADLIPIGSFKVEKLAAFWKANQPTGENTEWSFHAMQRLMYQNLHRGWGNTFGVQTRGGELMAATFQVYSHGRIFPLFTSESKEGAAAGAGTYLMANTLQTHASRPLKIRREEVLRGLD